MLKGISSKAHKNLKNSFESNKIKNPVVTVVLSPVMKGEPESIGVGIYENEEFSDNELYELNGIEFYIDPALTALVDGKYLDIANGKYILIEKLD